MSYEYVAAPYTDPDTNVQWERAVVIETIVAQWTAIGRTAFSPVLYYRPIVEHVEWHKGSEVGHEFKFWREHCLRMLAGASMLALVRLDGWEKSVGVTAEIERAQQLGIPIVHYDADGDLCGRHV